MNISEVKHTPKRSYRQFFFIIWALGWAFFVIESLNHQHREWFPFLIIGRIVLLLTSIIIGIKYWLQKPIWSNSETVFLTLCLGFQSVCGVLEGPQNTEFTESMAIFIIAISTFHGVSQKIWTYQLFPTICLIIAFPLFFKSETFFTSLSTSLVQFRAVGSSTMAGFLLGLANAMKNKALTNSLQLQKELFNERDRQSKRFEELSNDLTNTKVASQLAQTIQMLAHDFRQPLSLAQSVVNTLSRTNDLSDIKMILEQAVPDIQRSVNNVNGMIAGILEMGSPSLIHQEPVRIESLFQLALQDVVRIHPNQNIAITYTLTHTSLVYVDPLKISRVLANILSNSIQALNRTPQPVLRFSSMEDGDWIHLVLGNNGPEIPKDSLPKLFDAFYTSNKKSGTGLGLAIAQKNVLAHGGKIWCVSNEKRGVEFHFTLPKHPTQTSLNPVALPGNISELLIFESEGLEAQKSKLENHKSPESQRSHVIIVEDMSLIREEWEVTLKKDGIPVFGFESPDALEMAIAQDSLLLTQAMAIILDNEFDTVDSNWRGLDYGKKLKSNGCLTPILLSSNGEFQKETWVSCVDKVIGKTALSGEELTRLLKQLSSK